MSHSRVTATPRRPVIDAVRRAAPVVLGPSAAQIALGINGTPRELVVEPRVSLLDARRRGSPRAGR